MNENKIPIIFIGTDKVGLPLLEKLAADERFEIRLVVTQIDKPAGRKMLLTAPPIKLKAVDLGLKVFQPDDINSDESLDMLRSAGADMIVLMAYGQILKKALLSFPEYGCVNVHASLLPKHRGASPIQQSLLHQDGETGITIMKMEEKMDSGPVYAKYGLPIKDDHDHLTLADDLAYLTAERAPEVFHEIVMDRPTPKPQDHSTATYCQKIHKSDGNIDWNESAEVISAKIRAFSGWPGTHSFWGGRRIKIIEAKPYYHESKEALGTVFHEGNAVLVACKENALLLEEVQLEGKTQQSITIFMKGHPDFAGGKLG